MRNKYYPAPMLPILAKKITRMRQLRKMTQEDFGRLFGVRQATVSRWESGKLSPEYPHLAKLAELAGEPLADFLESTQDPIVSLPGTPIVVRGSVAAGVWREAWEWPEEDRFVFHGGMHIDVQGEGRFGLRVEGDSMNLVYPHGTLLDCIATYTTIAPNPGQRVIVVRTSVSGEKEATVKEYTRSSDGAEWLLPRSTHPDFQAPISLASPGDDVVEVMIIGIVVGSYRPE